MKRALSFGIFVCSLAGVVFASAPHLLFAQTVLPYPSDFGLNNIYESGDIPEFTKQKDVAVVAGAVLRVILGLLALFSMIVFIFAGALWMQARGSEEDVQKAKDMLKYAFLGLVVTFAGYATLTLVTQQLTTDFGSHNSSRSEGGRGYYCNCAVGGCSDNVLDENCPNTCTWGTGSCTGLGL